MEWSLGILTQMHLRRAMPRIALHRSPYFWSCSIYLWWRANYTFGCYSWYPSQRIGWQRIRSELAFKSVLKKQFSSFLIFFYFQVRYAAIKALSSFLVACDGSVEIFQPFRDLLMPMLQVSLFKKFIFPFLIVLFNDSPGWFSA